jgi:hypothetical protein
MILYKCDYISIRRADTLGPSDSPAGCPGTADINGAQIVRNLERRDFLAREINYDQLDFAQRRLSCNGIDDTLRAFSARAGDEYG